MNKLSRFAAAALMLSALARTEAQKAPIVTPIQVVNNHVYVRVVSGGHALWFLLDTGAGTCIFDLATADSLNIERTGKAQFGGVGPARTQGALLKETTVHLADDTSVIVAIKFAMPMTGLKAFDGVPVNGILGQNFIAAWIMQIDYVGKRLILHDPKSFKYTGPGIHVPITIKDDWPHLKVEVELADGKRVRADAVVDVGSSGALILTKPFVEKNRATERVGPTIVRSGGRGAGGLASQATMGRVSHLNIGTLELPSVTTSMYGDSAGVLSTNRFEANIGGEILRRFNVYFDYYYRKEMIWEPNGALAEPFEVEMSGAAFRLDSLGAGIRITDLMPKGPAEEAGLVADDLITTIDGRPALEYGLDALRQRLKRDGGEVVFTVRRDGADREIRLLVRRLI